MDFSVAVNIEKFATGMDGDEDLGQDISMKGEFFSFLLGEPAALGMQPEKFAIGMNGDEDLG